MIVNDGYNDNKHNNDSDKIQVKRKFKRLRISMNCYKEKMKQLLQKHQWQKNLH